MTDLINKIEAVRARTSQQDTFSILNTSNSGSQTAANDIKDKKIQSNVREYLIIVIMRI